MIITKTGQNWKKNLRVEPTFEHDQTNTGKVPILFHSNYMIAINQVNMDQEFNEFDPIVSWKSTKNQ